MASISKLRAGAKLLNKITGEELVIATVTSTEAVAVTGEVIPAENMECFQYIGNDTVAPLPQATVVDGILTVDGKMVVTGDIKPVAVLATFPGKVLLNCEGNIKWYMPELDKFESFGETAERVEVIEIPDGDKLLLREDVEKTSINEEQPDGTEKAVEVLAFRGASLIGIDKNGETFGKIYLDQPLNSVRVERGLCIVESKAILTTVETEDEDIEVISEADKINSVVIFSVKTVEEDGEVEKYIDKMYEAACDGPVVATVSRIANANGSLLVIDDKTVTYTNNGYTKRVFESPVAVVAASSHPYVVGVKFAGDVNSIRLADKDYNVITLQSVKTKDRGIVISVQ